MPREVRVATISNWRAVQARADPHATICRNVAHAVDVLSSVALTQPDIGCFPEFFNLGAVCFAHAAEVAEPLDGATITTMSGAAKRFGVNLICPIYELRDGQVYNAAIVLNREGAPIAVYDKRHPTQGEMAKGIIPGGRATPVIDTDFGHIAIETCFDINWADDWREACAGGAEIIFWPSAYNGGWPLRALASMHRVYVVSSCLIWHGETTMPGTNWIVDITGRVLARTGRFQEWTAATIDLEKGLFHTDYNADKSDALWQRYGSRLRWEWFHNEHYFTLASVDPDLSLDDVIAEFGLETMDLYLRRQTELQRQAILQSHR